MNAKRRTVGIFLVVAILLLVTLACGTSTTPSPQATQDGQAQAEPSEIVETTKTSEPTKATEPPATPTQLQIGLSRENPFPREELVSAPNWDVQVIEVKRGEEAWKDIQAANMFNETPPEGMEYLLVKIHAESTYADSDEHSIGGCDFDVTGDKLINYTCGLFSVVEPDPQLDANLFTGGETEGWAGYLIAQGEGNLMLVVNESMNFESDAKRYIALDDGASIRIPSDLASITPTDSGKDRNVPAPRTEKTTTEDWELSILDVIRGEEAWKMVQEANQFNEPPLEGFEYIAVKVHVRYIGTEDNAVNLDGSFFKSTGSAGILHDMPSVVDPSPQLDIWLYPGGESEGWVVVQASQGETNMTLVFEPWFDFSGDNKRFISLEQ